MNFSRRSYASSSTGIGGSRMDLKCPCPNSSQKPEPWTRTTPVLSMTSYTKSLSVFQSVSSIFGKMYRAPWGLLVLIPGISLSLC